MDEFIKTTEQPSHYDHLEKMPIKDILTNINREDKTVANAVEKAIPQIERLVTAITGHMLAGGRLFYIGAGTSGRVAVVDASELPPTFGIPLGLVIPIIAGGEQAITQAVEFAEDNNEEGWNVLKKHLVGECDIVLGLAASGTTPFVVGALQQCRQHSITTGCITCNQGTPLAKTSDFAVEIIAGAEFITGSTRMKCGTAQKLALNMISTAVMLQLGRVTGNKMVNMQLSNVKLLDRGVRMVMEQLKLADYEAAKKILIAHGSVKKALENSEKSI